MYREPTRTGLERYDCHKMVGEGTFGTVFRSTDLETGQTVAVKKIRLFDAEMEGVPASSIREIALLKELSKHPNIVRLLDVCHTQSPGQNEISDLILVFEFLDRDLKHLLDNTRGNLNPTLVCSYMYQLLRGVEYCHSYRTMHRDLKPQNLLIDKNGLLKIADLGLARTFNIPIRTLTHEVITLWYRSPEILLGQTRYSLPVDIWSVGCIFAEMVTSRPLFPGDSEIDELYQVFRVLGTPTPEMWPGVERLPNYAPDTFPRWPRRDLAEVVPGLDAVGYDLLGKLLRYAPSERLTATEALAHPYFANVNKALYADQENLLP